MANENNAKNNSDVSSNMSVPKPLSKSQKKRMKRKTKASKENQAVNAGGDDISTTSSTEPVNRTDHPAKSSKPAAVTQLNPIDIMRANVLKKGFRAADVDRAMNEMWEKELPYDEEKAVLDYLTKAKSRAPAADSPAGSDAQPVATPGKADLGLSTDKPDVKVENVPEDAAPVTEVSAEVSADVQVTETPSQPITASFTGLSAAAKLDLISKSGCNAHDLVFALSEWVKSSNSPEPAAMIASHSDLINQLLLSCVLDCTDSDYSKRSGHLVNLLALVSSSADKNEFRLHLTKTFQAARKVVTSLADATDAQVEEKVRTASEKTLLSAISSQLAAGRHTSQAPTRNGAKAGDDIRALLTKRDKLKKEALMASIQLVGPDKAQLADTESNGHDGKPPSTPLDSDLVNMFAESKAKYDEGILSLDDLNDRFSSSKNAADSALESCLAEKDNIQARREAYMAELKALDEQEKALDGRTAEIRSSIDVLSAKNQSDKAILQDQMKAPKKVTKIAKAYRSLSDAISSFEKDAIAKQLAADSMNGHNHTAEPTTPESSPEETLKAFADYLHTESQLNLQLKKRVTDSSNRKQTIEREMIECKNLGLTTNAAELARALQDAAQGFEEDEKASQKLMDEALALKSEVLKAVRLLAEQGSIHSTHFGVMKKIDTALTSLHINDAEFASLIPEGTGEKEVDLSEHYVDMGDLMEDDNASQAPAFDETPLSQNDPQRPYDATASLAPIAPPPKMPKFSWASAAATATAPNDTKSLREIQEEERVARNS